MSFHLPAFNELLWDLNQGVLTLTFNRTERRNAITTVMLAELLFALEAADDAAVRVVILRGAGKGFCPGDELRGMGALPDDFPTRPQVNITHAALQQTLRELPKPTIAVVHGFAFGVGLDVAMACDFRIASDDAQVRDQRVLERGMHAVTGCAWFQPRALGLSRALEFLILGKPYSGAEAATAGMMTESHPLDQLDAAVATMAGILAQAPTKAIGLMKRQVYAGLEMSHTEFMAFAAPLIHEVDIQDRAEGIKAFLEKRAPNFTGT